MSSKNLTQKCINTDATASNQNILASDVDKNNKKRATKTVSAGNVQTDIKNNDTCSSDRDIKSSPISTAVRLWIEEELSNYLTLSDLMIHPQNNKSDKKELDKMNLLKDAIKNKWNISDESSQEWEAIWTTCMAAMKTKENKLRAKS